MLGAILSELAPELATRGFPTNRNGCFRRPTPHGWQEVVVAAPATGAVTHVSVDLLIRFDAIQRILNTTGPLSRPDPTTCTLAISLSPLQWAGTLRWELRADSEVGPAVREIIETYDQIGAAYFQRYSDVASVAHLLSEETDEAIALGGTPGNRLATAVVSAFLVGGGRLAFRRSVQKRGVAAGFGVDDVARFDEFCEDFFASLLPAPEGAEPPKLPPEGKWSDLTRKIKKTDPTPRFLDGGVEFFVNGAWEQMYALPREVVTSREASAAALRAVSAAAGVPRSAPPDLSKDVRRRLPGSGGEGVAWATYREVERTRWGTTPDRKAAGADRAPALFASGREHTTGWAYVETRAAAEAQAGAALSIVSWGMASLADSTGADLVRIVVWPTGETRLA